MSTGNSNSQNASEACRVELSSQNNETCLPGKQLVGLLAGQEQQEGAQHQALSCHSNTRQQVASEDSLFSDNHKSCKNIDAHRHFMPATRQAQDTTGENGVAQQRGNAFCEQPGERRRFGGHSLSWFARKGKHVVQDYHSSDSKSFDKLLKMARKRYFVSALCLCLFGAACLLGSVAISRTIGSLDLDSATSKDSEQARLTDSRPPEQFEVRTFELVDLIEADKTFAYTKWRVTVRVPKSTPVHRQHSLGLSSIESAAAEGPGRTAIEPNERKLGPEPDPDQSSDASERTELEAGPEAEDALYRLTGTRAFVADHSGVSGDQGGNKTSEQQANQSGPPQGDPVSGALFGRPGRDQAPLEADDPIQVAANEMNVEASAINSTIVDCFIVDTEKRYSQKLAIESRHKQVASTRRVGFKRMLATITTCRLLTWATLANQLNSTTGGQLQASGQLRRAVRQAGQIAHRAPIPIEQTQIAPHVRSGAPQVATTTPPAGRVDPFGGILNEVIKPVERAPIASTAGGSAQKSDANDPLGSLIGALVSWSQIADNTTGAGQRAAIGPMVVENNLPKDLGAGELKRAGEVSSPWLSNQAQPQQPTQSAPNSIPDSVKAEDEANRASYLNMGVSMISGIVPNTLWCGLGDRAANYSELGAEFMIDACCRAHDHCPVRLRPFTADYGLVNWSMSTRSHCDCDLDFNECLTTINSTLSNVIKTLYFRFVGLQCVDLEGRGRHRPATVKVQS